MPAGGLALLEQFIGSVPLGSGRSCVVVQHMDPTHEGMLSARLQRVIARPVREATGGAVIAPNVVNVIPPYTELSVGHGALHLSGPVAGWPDAGPCFGAVRFDACQRNGERVYRR